MNSEMGRRLGIVFLAIAMTALSAPAMADSSYQVTKTVALGGPDRWDYVVCDPVMNRVYVAHGEVVTVVDGTSGAIIGTVEGMAGGTHGIAIVNVLGKGYTDDGKAGTAVAFDLRSLTVLKQIKVDPGADGIVYDAPSGHVLVIEGGSAKIAVIDPRTDAVVATVDGGGDLEYAVSGGNGKLYVNGAEKNEIVRVDTRSNLVDAHWPMAACTKPHGLAIDRPHRRLFASCANKIMVVLNADSGEVLANVPIGDGTDFAEFDDKRGLAFSSNRDGTLSIVAEQSPSSFVAQPAVATEFGARTMALNPLTGRLYLVTADFTVNDAVPATDPRHRYSVKPGTTRLLFLDPATP